MSSYLKLVKSVALTPRRLADSIAQKYKRRHCTIARESMLLPSARVDNFLGDTDAIRVGPYTLVAGQLLVFAHGGRIEIGSDCFVGEGTRIWSASSIRIGNRVLISHGVNIHDSNSHSLSARSRHEHIKDMFANGHPSQLPDVADAPICIEDDVWVGFNAVILKGVVLGRGCVVGSAAVVTKNVEPYSVVVGNPARHVTAARP